MKRAIWWIKRDFRLQDNEALVSALKHVDEVLPLFVFERDYISQPDISPLHVWAWIEAVKDLKNHCQLLHGDVLISKGNVFNILENLHQQWSFTDLYSHEETGNDWTYQRDIKVGEWCKKQRGQLA